MYSIIFNLRGSNILRVYISFLYRISKSTQTSFNAAMNVAVELRRTGKSFRGYLRAFKNKAFRG